MEESIIFSESLEFDIYPFEKGLKAIEQHVPKFKNVELTVELNSGFFRVNLVSDDQKHYNRVQSKLKKTFETVFHTAPNKSFLEWLHDLLKEENQTISFAESITGGMLASLFISLPGSSEFIKESYVTYSDEAKVKVLGVSEDMIKKYGVVSKEVAMEMALGLSRISNADICVSTTGIAGPTGQSKDHPLGEVIFGIKTPKKLTAARFVFTGDRDTIRKKASAKAIILLIKELS